MLSAADILKVGFQRQETKDTLGRRIIYYHSPVVFTDNLPLTLYVQGSGYHPLFWCQDGQIVGQHQRILADVGKGRIQIICVDKPGIDYNRTIPIDGCAIDAPANFLQEHTLERWSTALYAALEAMLAQRNTPTRIMVMGHSEGAAACARLARLHSAITHVGVLSGSGPSQLFDFVYNEYIENKKIEEMLSKIEYVISAKENDISMLWGHPVCRWRSFFGASTLDDLLKSDVSVFCAHGSEDKKVPFASALVLLAEFLRCNRPITFHPVYGGDHSFRIKEESSYQGMRRVFTKVLDWYCV